MSKWKYESDGGKTWVGTHWSHQPVTHYLTNREERIDFDSKEKALQYLAMLEGQQHA